MHVISTITVEQGSRERSHRMLNRVTHRLASQTIDVKRRHLTCESREVNTTATPAQANCVCAEVGRRLLASWLPESLAWCSWGHLKHRIHAFSVPKNTVSIYLIVNIRQDDNASYYTNTSCALFFFPVIFP